VVHREADHRDPLFAATQRLHGITLEPRQMGAQRVLPGFEEGWEIPPDLTAAHRWYRCAAERGDFRAQFNLGTLLAKRDRIAEATEWLRAAVLGATPDVVRLVAGTLLQSSVPAMRDVGYLALKRLADCEDAALLERHRGDGTKG
jgi:TPR repeat protein